MSLLKAQAEIDKQEKLSKAAAKTTSASQKPLGPSSSTKEATPSTSISSSPSSSSSSSSSKRLIKPVEDIDEGKNVVEEGKGDTDERDEGRVGGEEYKRRMVFDGIDFNPMNEDEKTLNDRGLEYMTRRALQLLVSRDLRQDLRAILRCHPEEQKVNVTSYRFRFESFMTDESLIHHFRREDLGSDVGDKVTSHNRIFYMSRVDVDELIASLETDLKDSNEDEDDEVKRKTDLHAKLQEGTENIGDMQHYSHADFASFYHQIYKSIPMTGDRNRWAIILNNGQFLFWLDFEKDCTLIVRDILLGMAEIYFSWLESGKRKFSVPLVILHKVFAVSNVRDATRILVQEKVHGIPNIVDNQIDDSISRAYNKALDASDNEDMKAETLLDCQSPRMLLWKSKTSLAAKTGDWLWHISSMTNIASSPSDIEFKNPRSLSTDTSARILAIGGTFSGASSIRYDLREYTTGFNFFGDQSFGISPVQFVVVSAISDEIKKTYIVNVGDNDINIVGKSMSKEPRHFLTLRTIPKAKQYVNFDNARDVKGFYQYIMSNKNQQQQLNYSRQAIFDSMVIQVGGYLLQFNASIVE